MHRQRLSSILFIVSTLSAVLFFCGCTSAQTGQVQEQVPTEFGEPRQEAVAQASYGQEQLLAAQTNHQRKVEVLFSAKVRKLLPDDTQGLPHQRFLLQLSNGSSVLVAHDTAMAPKVPIQPGCVVTIKGEYIWNEKGGVVHWTHHTDTPRHEGGYIDFGGQRYQ